MQSVRLLASKQLVDRRDARLVARGRRRPQTASDNCLRKLLATYKHLATTITTRAAMAHVEARICLIAPGWALGDDTAQHKSKINN